MIRYALFSLPGLGSQVVSETTKAGFPPALLVTAKTGDLSHDSIPCISIDDPALLEKISSCEIELLLVAGWEKRIEREFYVNLKYGGWNVHPSLLPEYRGHNPYFWTIANGETRTGVSVHVLTDELDAGPVLLQKEIEITTMTTLGKLWNDLAIVGAQAAVEALNRISAGDVEVVEQIAGQYRTAPRVSQDDLLIRKDRTKEENLRLIRAANPFYGALLETGSGIIKVFEATDQSTGPAIQCSDGTIGASVLGIDGYGMISGNQYTINFPWKPV